MHVDIFLFILVSSASAQFPEYGQRFGGIGDLLGISSRIGRPNPVYGGGIGPVGGNQGFQSGYGVVERSYYVRGRVTCGIQGTQAARVSLWENRGGGQPNVYEDKVVDASGSFYLKAEIRGGGYGGNNGNGNLFMTINHNCNGGNRQLTIGLPPSYINQGLTALKTFDLGTINLEARYSEETNAFIGGGRQNGLSSSGNPFGNVGLPRPI